MRGEIEIVLCSFCSTAITFMLPGYGGCSVILLFLLFFLLCVVLLCDFLMFPGARHGESGIGLYRWGMVGKKKKTMHTKWGRTDSGGEMM
jgi:hypothetical protein